MEWEPRSTYDKDLWWKGKASKDAQMNIKYYKSYVIKIKNRIHCKVVKEIIRIADAEKEEY